MKEDQMKTILLTTLHKKFEKEPQMLANTGLSLMHAMCRLRNFGQDNFSLGQLNILPG